LSSLVLQAQAVFTAVFAMLALRERPGGRRLTGLAVAAAGIVLIALDLGASSPLGAFGLIVAAAAMWGLSNVLMRKANPPDSLRFMVWVSALAVLPLLALSAIFEGPQRDLTALRTVPWSALAAVCYVGLLATVFGFGVWGYLIRTYSASTVAPFSMLAPVFAMATSALVTDEQLTVARVAAAALIVGGVLFGATGGNRLQRKGSSPAELVGVQGVSAKGRWVGAAVE
jgi:O-acetylserine/cysteine efflux transporter